MNVFKKTALSLSLLIASTAAFADMNSPIKGNGEPPPCMQDQNGGCQVPTPGAVEIVIGFSSLRSGAGEWFYNTHYFSDGFVYTDFRYREADYSWTDYGSYVGGAPYGSEPGGYYYPNDIPPYIP